MRKTQLAEWILSLVTEADQAPAIVGDFLEQAETRGAAWFWLTILRTAGSFTWSAIAADPLRMVATGILACVAELVGFVVAAVGISMLGRLAMHPLILGPAVPPHTRFIVYPWWILIPPYVCAGLWISFLIGRSLARRWPGREIAACSCFIAINLLLIAIPPSAKTPILLALWITFQCVAMAGAISARRRRQKAKLLA